MKFEERPLTKKQMESIRKRANKFDGGSHWGYK
ncbi:hypothetical protein LCGC14_2912160, partial [marine sediment metagenome]